MFSPSIIKPAFSDHNVAIIFASDAHYAEIVSVAIQSLVDHANLFSDADHYDILLIADGLDDDQLRRITQIAAGKPKVSIRFLDASVFKERSQSYHVHYLSVATFYRLCLPSMLPEYEKILYLDCDVLIQADVAELYHTDLGTNLIAGVQDRAIQYIVHDWINKPKQQLKADGLNPEHYFNAGVVLMNLAQMRFERTELIFNALSGRSDLAWMDQDILNIAAKNCWMSLPDRWNHTLHMYIPPEIASEGLQLSESLNNDVAIVHYACGARKPWEFWPSHFEQAWWEVAMRSPSREQLMHRLDKDEESKLREAIQQEQWPVLPDMLTEWDAYRQGSIKLAKMNYIQRVIRENTHDAVLLESPSSAMQPIKISPQPIIDDQSGLPLLTVITASYNLVKTGRVDYLRQTIQSVINQTYAHIEHLVIDGGSTDGTIDILEELQTQGLIKYISEPDRGVYDAMNKGTLLAQGKYVAYLNTDDYWHDPDGMSMCIQMLEKSGADFSYAPYTYLHPEGDQLKITPELGAFFIRMPICHQAMVIRKDAIVNMGLYDIEFKIAADYDYLVKSIMRHRPFVYVPLDYTLFRMGGLCCTDVDTSYHECAVLLSRNLHGNGEWVPFFESFCRDQICSKGIFDSIRARVTTDIQQLMDNVVEPFSSMGHTIIVKQNPCKKVDVDNKKNVRKKSKSNTIVSEPTVQSGRNAWLKLFGFIPLIRIKMRPSFENNEKTVYKLFGCIPLMKVKRTVSRTSYYLFHFLPIVKVKNTSSVTKRYFFFFIPLFKYVR